MPWPWPLPQQVDEGVATKEDVDRGTKIGLAWRQGPLG